MNRAQIAADATARGLSAHEALLSAAAAQTPAERLAAELALIATGTAMLTRPSAIAAPLVGDGTAGRGLLGRRTDPHDSSTLARRVRRIATNHPMTSED